MKIEEVESQLKFYKANYPLKKEEIMRLETMKQFIDFIEDDETEFNIKLNIITKYLANIKPKRKKVIKDGKEGTTIQ